MTRSLSIAVGAATGGAGIVGAAGAFVKSFATEGLFALVLGREFNLGSAVTGAVGGAVAGELTSEGMDLVETIAVGAASGGAGAAGWELLQATADLVGIHDGYVFDPLAIPKGAASSAVVSTLKYLASSGNGESSESKSSTQDSEIRLASNDYAGNSTDAGGATSVAVVNKPWITITDGTKFFESTLWGVGVGAIGVLVCGASRNPAKMSGCFKVGFLGGFFLSGGGSSIQLNFPW